MKIFQENDGKPPSYDIPEHAKSLLSKPTEVLEIKNVVRVFFIIYEINLCSRSVSVAFLIPFYSLSLC
jgi:hypothetical protein